MIVKRLAAVSCALLLACSCAQAYILDEEWVHPRLDPLAPRDEHGLLHQMKDVRPTDFASRYPYRWQYYFKAGEQLSVQPAYVAALQRDLRRLGYYCGKIDGFFTPDVSYAIARLQKNHSMQVTGTLTEAVRHALHLP